MARGQQGAVATSPSGPTHGGSPVARSGGGAPSSPSSEKGQRLRQHTGASGSPRAKSSAMTRVEPTTRVAEVKLIEKRPPLPPGGQRRSKDGLKERSEVHTRGTHSKTKTNSASTSPLSGESEVNKSETKRSMNIARALEAVMPDPRNKTRKVEKKIDEHVRKDSQVLQPTSPQSSPGTSLSLERKKVASSREGDKTTRRGIHPSSNSPT
ncbi:uncharacterized protein [Hetaerina americana]|uniref:uncharacterized protein n=1 Tax=Hetaerina americana TaxID=62018 RepID=UPI003A7F5A1D